MGLAAIGLAGGLLLLAAGCAGDEARPQATAMAGAATAAAAATAATHTAATHTAAAHTATTADTAAATAAATTAPADFAVRGRWPDPRQLTYRLQGETCPLGAESFARASQRAMQVWAATGVVGFRPANEREPADVTLGFRRGHHGACEPFGPGADVAHTGPVAPGSFVHFDAGRTWSEHGGAGSVSMFHTALHELGHVLGLGHSEAENAVMGTSSARPSVLSADDCAGLHSLYGGGVDGAGDLRITSSDGSVVVVLRAVAPPAQCAFGVFDCDGDGDQEVIVWRTDEAGHGRLTVHDFSRGPALQRTIGPWPGVVVPGARVGFVVGPAGERLLVSVAAAGRRVAWQFDRHGIPELPSTPVADSVLAAASLTTIGDLDGDGRPEKVARTPAR